MIDIPAPASFQRAPADAVANKPVHQKDQAPRGVTGTHGSGVNDRRSANYSNPQGTVFVDRESHSGAWAKFLKDTNHGS